ncbi:30S ribosomal protein S12 methylthiotransferase RimO [Soehngenia saccharolytica]|nr:30S ribosomal protein S12 methylthiotransferase RimO [Soehngenia saccharolytica]
MNTRKIYFETLGCSKNEVDTNIMKSMLDKNLYEITENEKNADIIVVNTCGFIEAAKIESIDAILDLTRLKQYGSCKYLVLTGCLAQRYPDELISEMPEIDAIIGTGNINKINEILNDLDTNEKKVIVDNINNIYPENIKREIDSFVQYVKISEGCNNNCTYCVIPKLRGKNRSRKIEDIISEIKYLVNNNVKEIILIAQNTTDYGIDLYGDYRLYELLNEIEKIEGDFLVRLMYLYPDHIDDKLISSIKSNTKIAKYLDIPLQHINNNVLKAMNRRTNKESIVHLIEKLRKEIPEVIIRTTFIVGFPGETEDDFNELYDFIQKIKFDKLGVFPYSREEGTTSFNYPNQIDEEVKLDRLERIMQVQKQISNELLRNKIGKTYRVLVDNEIENGLYEGRSYMDSPEIDGVIFIQSSSPLQLGQFINVHIVDSIEYDLMGVVENEFSK